MAVSCLMLLSIFLLVIFGKMRNAVGIQNNIIDLCSTVYDLVHFTLYLTYIFRAARSRLSCHQKVRFVNQALASVILEEINYSKDRKKIF